MPVAARLLHWHVDSSTWPQQRTLSCWTHNNINDTSHNNIIINHYDGHDYDYNCHTDNHSGSLPAQDCADLLELR